MKSVEEIYRELLEAFGRRAGYTPEDNCELSVRLYAAAAQIQALSVQNEWVLAQSFPQTAQGEYLDHHAAARGLQRIGEAKAKGTVRFMTDTPSRTNRIIDAGTTCMTAGEVRFVTTEAVTLAAGESAAEAPAEALIAGPGGNVAAGTVTILTACPVGITACTNPRGFSGGAEAESDEALRLRILESYRRLPNGANAAWYEAAAMSCEGVAAAAAVGRVRGTGTVDVYITGVDGMPDDVLLESVRQVLADMREIAVDVQVKAPVSRDVCVEAEIMAAPGTDYAAVAGEVEQAVTAWFNGGLLGKPVRMADLGRLIYNVSGVENYHLLSPAEDVQTGRTELPVLDILDVTKMQEG